MRWLVLGLSLSSCWALGCKTPDPVQNPLDYLQIGVDPRAEAAAVMKDLTRHGYRIGTEIQESGYVAFDATSGVETLVRVMTERGTALSIETPDVRAPERLQVALHRGVRPDFNADGRRDPVIAVRERDRSCLFWAEVDDAGFVTPVFRPEPTWGDSPCVLQIHDTWPQLLLEVSVPGESALEARVRVPIHADARGWEIDETPGAIARWEASRQRRRDALVQAEASGRTRQADRLRAELRWMDELLPEAGPTDETVPLGVPVLEPGGNGQ